MSRPVAARPMIRRWISDVPSKIVKILAIRGPVAAATADPTEIRFSGPFSLASGD
jgi:hypothetical protein